ncbi:hypothetical protein TSUD_329190 [Trifolium subterraneum]|uniref:Uncharacterized protein n=1 Tax=Trifolium subterraneum TaxID=3900 RepID=A0A2Z6NRV5_TRISU|nr:hypothetical protein TSUD_329190 [Trifolium subterraneum]
MEEIRSLQRKVTTMEKEHTEQNVDSDDESLVESHPLRQSLWDSKVPDNFKSPHLPTFDGTLKDAALRWYMNLPNNSIESYADFHKKFIHQFSGTKHINVTATSLFTICHNYAETLREYLARFSEATITVSNPNQEMFVAAFHNGLKDGHFNESLAQKPATSMQEVVKRASCYIKGEESNAEKRSRDAKEKDSRNNSSKGQNSQPQRNWQNSDTYKQGYRAKPYYPPNVGGGRCYPRHRRYPADREYTPLNKAKVHVLHEILQEGLTPLPPPRMNNIVMGPNTEAWCAYHKCKGHDTERCFRLRDLIEDLIRSGHLRKFLEDAAKGQIALLKQIPYQQKGEGNGGNKGEKHRVAVNTISGGFAGGGESNSARKCYIRRSRFEICLVILNCDVKRVLIDSGISAGILYWDAYKAMRLSDEQLNPYYGPLVGFAGEQVDVMGHITLFTTFGEKENAKTIKVQIGEQPHQTINVGTSLQQEEKERIITILRNNRDLFAWQPSDMSGIDESIITHKLSISSTNKLVVQQKRKVEEERITAIIEEVAKLKEAGFIEEIKYPTWLIDGASGYKMLSFMDAYSGYNQIKMHPMDAQHTAFMSNTYNYSYNVMLFGLKNAGATCQRMMDRVFVEQIGKNLEVYIDDMVVKTEKEGEHDKDLYDILKSVRKYNMRLNPAKCSFGVQADKYLSEKACHFFATLRKSERFTWSPQCEEAFQKLKVFLASPPILTRPEQGKTLYLYLAVSEKALSSALKNERLCLAVVIIARKLRQYFQSHQVVVNTDYPLKNVLQKPDLAGRMVAWLVELSKFDITYIPKGAIKSQALADFVLELTNPPSENEAQPWTFPVDGSSNLRGSGVGVVLEGPEGVLIEQSLRFTFKASNNQAEYETLIAGMKLAEEMEVQELKVHSDSQLVANQISGEFQTKDPQLAKYLEKVKGMVKHFTMFELTYVPREQNASADLLAKLASIKKPDEVTKIRKMAAWYTMVGDKLYKRGFSASMLLCVSDTEACRILNEIHEGSCGSHIGSRSLAGKVMRAGFYWPNLHDNAARHVRTCDKCQSYSNLHHASGEPLKSVLSPWPFYMWGVDILGPFSISSAQAKWIVVAVDYFTKWVEAEPVSGISADQVIKFYRKKIICRFGLPKYIVSDNDTQFASEKVVEYCRGKGIQNTFISVEHPQANGQAESANKVILTALKRRKLNARKLDAMIPVEIQPSTWRRDTLTMQENNAALEESLDILPELREKAHFREFYTKQRAARKYNTRVIPRKLKEDDLVLKRPWVEIKEGRWQQTEKNHSRSKKLLKEELTG